MSDSDPGAVHHVLLPVGAILLVALALAHHVGTTGIGWDFGTYVAAVDAFGANANGYSPRVLEEYGGRYPFVYLPVTLLALVPLTSLVSVLPLPAVVAAEYTLFALVAAVLLSRLVSESASNRATFLWVVAVVVAGFQGFYWSVYSGNVDVFGGLLFVGSLWAVSEDRFTVSGTLLGALSLLKLFPIALVGVYLLAPCSRYRTLRSVAATAGTVAVGLVVSWLLLPAYFPDAWLSAVRAESPPVVGQGFVFQVSTMYALEDIAAGLGVHRVVGVVAYGVGVLGLLFVGGRWLSRRETTVSSLALGAALLLVALPRLKPYYLVYATPAVVLLSLAEMRRVDSARGVALVVAVFGVPIFGMLAYTFLGRGGVRALPPVVVFLLRYAPLVGLWGWIGVTRGGFDSPQRKRLSGAR